MRNIIIQARLGQLASSILCLTLSHYVILTDIYDDTNFILVYVYLQLMNNVSMTWQYY